MKENKATKAASTTFNVRNDLLTQAQTKIKGCNGLRERQAKTNYNECTFKLAQGRDHWTKYYPKNESENKREIDTTHH